MLIVAKIGTILFMRYKYIAIEISSICRLFASRIENRPKNSTIIILLLLKISSICRLFANKKEEISLKIDYIILLLLK